MAVDDISSVPKKFYPASVSEFIGLRIASKLDDLEHLYFYLRFCFRFNERIVVERLNQVGDLGLSGPEFAERFRDTFKN